MHRNKFNYRRKEKINIWSHHRFRLPFLLKFYLTFSEEGERERERERERDGAAEKHKATKRERARTAHWERERERERYF